MLTWDVNSKIVKEINSGGGYFADKCENLI